MSGYACICVGAHARAHPVSVLLFPSSSAPLSDCLLSFSKFSKLSCSNLLLKGALLVVSILCFEIMRIRMRFQFGPSNSAARASTR